ncbi:hypothetical protein LCGC14_2172020 [marine sediment metagenome]|uniref:AAA domain-containing protein n=1 Tax=marine sediment metagenome TaxID=412755 RepID=A0A0F9G2I3_9ZZZZ
MTKIIAVAMQKGGVGKTTTALHLSHALAMSGRKVLLIDTDPQASATDRFFSVAFKGTLADVLGVQGEGTMQFKDVITPTHQQNLWLIPADDRLEDSAKRVDDQNSSIGGIYAFDLMLRGERLPFDYVILDTPPGRSSLLMASLVAADEVIMPVQLQPMGFEGFDKLISGTIQQARRHQSIRGEIRLRLRAVVPTFYNQNQLASKAFLRALENAEHPDYEDMPLPLAPQPVVESTGFVNASAPIPFDVKGQELYRARTIWEMTPGNQQSTIVRGQQAYEELARYVDSYA